MSSKDLDRLLTDDDVKAIVSELKAQLVKDFQIEVGKGVLGWVKKALILLVLLAALYGIAGTSWFYRAAPAKPGGGEKPAIPAIVGKVAMRAAGIKRRGFIVLPPNHAPADLTELAQRLDELNRSEQS